MKRKTLFAILFLIMFSSVLSFVNADELDAQLVFPGSDELKEIIDKRIKEEGYEVYLTNRKKDTEFFISWSES